MLMLESCGLSIFLREWARQLARLNEAVAQFSIDNVTCFDENDRSIVQNNVIDLMRISEQVAFHASGDEALAAFDNLVRADVPLAIRFSVGRVGVPGRYFVLATIPYIVVEMAKWFVWFHDYLTQDSDGVITLVRPGRIAMDLMFFVVVQNSVYVLGWLVLVGLSKRSLGLRGAAECGYVMLSGGAYIIFFVVVSGSLWQLDEAAKKSAVYLALQLFVSCVIVICPLAIFRMRRSNLGMVAGVDRSAPVLIEPNVANGRPVQVDPVEPVVAGKLHMSL